VAEGNVRCCHRDWTERGAVACTWSGTEDELIFDPHDECPDDPRLVCPRCLTGDWGPDERTLAIPDLPALTPLANLVRRHAYSLLREWRVPDDAERCAGIIAVSVCMDRGLDAAIDAALRVRERARAVAVDASAHPRRGVADSAK